MDRYVVRCRQDSYSEGIALFRSYGIEVAAELRQINAFVIVTNAATVASFEGWPQFLSIALDGTVTPGAISVNDPLYSGQWAFANARLTDVWTPSSGAGVKVAIVDTAFDPTHEDFAGANITFVNPVDATPIDSGIAHGTSVLSIMAAQPNNSKGLIGVCPAATFLACKYGDGTSEAKVIQALLYAVDWGASVINVSLVLSRTSTLINDAIRYAEAHGSLVVLIGGNDATGTEVVFGYDSNPALLMVSGHDSGYNRQYSYGDWLDITAPSANMTVAVGGGSSYSTTWAGTSCAAPIVTGICAMLKQARPELTQIDISRIVCQSANWSSMVGKASSSWDKQYGWGAIDAQAALALVDTWTLLGGDLPDVVIVSPAHQGALLSGSPVDVVIAARDDKSFVKVELLVNDAVAFTNNAPTTVTTFSWTPAARGSYSLKARVTDSVGYVVTSPVTTVHATLGAYTAAASMPTSALSLTPAGSFSLRARFVNDGGVGPWSSPVAISGASLAPADVPQGLMAIPSGADYLVYYRPSDNAASHQYQLEGDASWYAASNPLTLPKPANNTNKLLSLKGANAHGATAAATLLLEGPLLSSASASQQVDSFAQTAVAAVRVDANISQQLDDFAQAAVAAVRVDASISQQMGAFVQDAAAESVGSASADQAVEAFNQVAVVAAIDSANASQQVGVFAQTTNVSVDNTASAYATQQVGNFSQAATAEARVDVSAAQQVGDFSQIATAKSVDSASAAQQVGDFVQAATAAVRVGASAAQQVGSFAQAATVTVQNVVSLSASQLVGAFAQTASAKANVAASASQQVGTFSQIATVATLNDGNAYASAAPVSTVAPGAAASGGAEASAGAASIQLQVAQATASVSAVASAAAASLALSPALAAATGSATATANVPAVQAAAPSASATGGGGAVATAHAAPIFSAAPAATASGNANVAANAAALSSQPPSGTAFAGSGAVASGALAALTTVAPAASASGAALVAGSPSSVQVGAPGASASAAATASASFNPISVAALQGGASVHVATSAGFQGIQLLPAAGGAQGSASASAVPALLRAFPPHASFAGYSVYVDDARLVPYRGSRRKVPALLKNRTVNKDRP